MTPYERLYQETTEARTRFLAIRLVKQAQATGGSRELYTAFLTEAYHHVKHTFPLLSLAAAHTRDEAYRDALHIYMNEEKGHDKWILDDIRAMGGNADAAAGGKGSIPTQVMVGYAYYCIEWISPYALLGMVHVLEGLSVMLAHSVAGAVQHALGTKQAAASLLTIARDARYRAYCAFQNADPQPRRPRDARHRDRGRARDVPPLRRNLRGTRRTLYGEGRYAA